ncbi:MAG: phosphoribosylanthranilate isomerase [Bacteroidota bacterium]|nr:phosphoribosylanthranilate isomerase [Bacteroidota bacterium]
MKIKVCGITKAEQLQQLDELGIDYAGLIYFSRSPRYVLDKLKSEEVKKIAISIQKVGVFVNASEEDILTQIELYGLDAVQLHGDETPLFCNHISNHVTVIKAFRIDKKNEQNIDWMIKPYEEFCDYYLFDTGNDNAHGGTGEKFDWQILQSNKINKPFFLSGGISVDDAEEIKAFQHPFFYAVDLNSKFETEPGIKNMDQVKNFVEQIKAVTSKNIK